ncbi:MAG TPA: 50S ribosomal protein L14 [Candidatus Levybacteria bacterium]|nr:50S ribosomal protein L14 [Candidatus Levybacteria bacterium]
MIQLRSKLVVADNSGVKELMVIQVYGGSRRRFGYLGDTLGCIAKKVLPNGEYKKGDLVKVVLVRTKKEVRRPDGSYVRFSENAGVVITSRENKDPIGTRVFGPIAREVRERGFTKIASLAKNVV